MMRPQVFEIPAGAPTLLTATQLTPTSIRLNWTNNSLSTTSFSIQRALDTGFTTGLTTLTYTGNGLAPSMTGPIFTSGATTFTDTTAVSGATYYYRVAAGKTFPTKQSPQWGAPGSANAVSTEEVLSPWSNNTTNNVSGILIVTPANAAFGSVPLTFTSLPITFTVSNNGIGNVPVSVSSISLTGTNSSMFQIQPGTCGATPTLQPNTSCQFSVTFRPTSTGNKTANVQVSSSGVNIIRPLTGTGVSAAAGGPVRKSSPTPVVTYSTMTAGMAAAQNLWSLLGWNVLLTEPSVNLNTAGTVYFSGGYNSTWTSNTGGYTGLNGTLTITQGALVVDSLAIY